MKWQGIMFIKTSFGIQREHITLTQSANVAIGFIYVL